MSANIKVVFIVVIGVGACLLSIFSSQYFHKKDNNNQLVLSHIDKVAVRIEHIRLLGRSFIQDADQTIWGQISETLESVRRNLQAAPYTDGRWRQEIESLNRSLENYHGILSQLYEPAFNLKAQKIALQEIGLEFSREVEKEIIKPYRKEEGLRIYDGESIDPFKARAKDSAYDLVALHIKQQLILLELLLSSDLEAYKQKKQYLSTALAQHKAQLRYMAILMGSEPSIQSVLESLDQKLKKLLNHEHAIIELFAALTELDDRLSAVGDKLLAGGNQLSSRITSDTLRTSRLNRIFNWSLLLGILGGLSVLGVLLARNIIQFVEDQKTAQQTIKESEEKYRSFIENAPVAMYTLNTKGEFTYGNRKLLEITGYKTEDWLNKLFHPIVHPEDLDFVIKRIQNRFEGKGAAEPYEIRIFHSSGEIMWVKIISVSIYDTDEMGMKKLIGMQSFIEDITGRKLTEEALRESEERFRELAELLPETIFEMDATGNLTFVNRKAYEHFRYTQQDFDQGLSGLDMVVPEDRHRAMENIAKILGGEHVGLKEYQALRKDGTTFPALFHSAAVLHEGKPAGMRGFIIDISEKKHLEAQLLQSQKMEAIGTLAGGIAHDFNNILSPIMTHTEMALMDLPEDSPLQFSLREVIKASERARDLVKQILAFSRQTDQEPMPLKLGLIIKDALKLLRSSIPTTIEIQQKIITESDAILADPTQMHQVIMNLCTNAFHAMREKGGLLEVSLTDEYVDSESVKHLPNLNPGSYLKLSVRDTGQGMEPDVIEKIFEPYFTTKDKGVGTGLGMAVVLGIVQDHGGSIHVQSEPGKGTTFDVFLPKIDLDIAEKDVSREQIPTGNERILLVDDEAAIVNVEKQMFKRLGYEVATRTSSIEALELFRSQPDRFDAVITDMTMPNMTGVELSKEIMSIRPDIPVILCTGFSERIDEKMALELGVKAFMMKPIVMSEMANTIRRVLDEK